MGRSKILLHTSMYEGFGIVCLEALAAGTYAISLTKPMEVPISNWHQVDTKEQMIEKAISVLLTAPDAKPVLPYLMEDSEEKMICLLSISKALPHEQLQQLV
jgi:glycosyltransferase involved in cell wall biosynthesis